VASRLKQCAYGVTLFLFSILVSVIAPMQSVAAPYAAMVMDARSGEVLHSRNADTRLHPASLTKALQPQNRHRNWACAAVKRSNYATCCARRR